MSDKTGTTPKLLQDLIKIDADEHLIVNLFWKLTSLGSNQGDFSILDIKAYSDLFGIKISLWDIDVLTAMQRAKQYSQDKRMK